MVSLEFYFVRFANSAARSLLLAGAVLIAACHKDVTNTVNVASVFLSPTNISLLVGDTVTIAASESDINGIVLAPQPVKWTSSDTTIAVVGASGIVTARKVGSVSITAVSGTASGVSKITVVAALPPSISSITVSPAPSFVVVHGTQQLKP